MKIYTRTGDTGETSLLRGGRVPKHHLRVDAYGTIDELNSWIGYVQSLCDDQAVLTRLQRLQPKLHITASDVAAIYREGESSKRVPRISVEDAEALEGEIDEMDEDLPMLTHFILPGGSPAGAALHIARTVCRRAERCITSLADQQGEVNPGAIAYVNRLSDYLFTLARWANHRANIPETAWTQE
ncbi:cob(I)yrinic acid a,c-diamide adenosyltransferase [bacterium]|nr:cob(I)yrinic acid a,c-diamide adenosyltransferase [bacterium]